MRQIRRRGIALAVAILVLALAPSQVVVAVVAPVATDDAYQTDEDTPLVISAPGVLENDDPGTCVAETDTSGLMGTLTMDPDGSFTYTPPADYHGETSFTYRLAEGGCPTTSVGHPPPSRSRST